MTSEPTTVATADGEMPAQLWRPTSGTGPGIVLVQEIFGISHYVERRARDLADLGYVVLAPEIYWRLGVTKVDEGPDAFGEAFALLQQVDWDKAVQDTVSAVAALRSRPERSGGVGIVGFCFGGGLGFNAAAVAEVDALVSYYGSALPDLLDLAPRVSAPSLHHFGLSDSFVDPPTVQKVRATLLERPGVTFETYEGADHAFDNDDFHLYDADASALAWGRTVAFLARHLHP